MHGRTLVRQYALRPDLLAVSHVWRRHDGDDSWCAAKGAPEAIADLCRLDAGATRLRCARRSTRWPADGLRVLGVAAGTAQPAAIGSGRQRDFAFEFLGLVGLADPLRADVPGGGRASAARPASAS